jgi:hypothetical protein
MNLTVVDDSRSDFVMWISSALTPSDIPILSVADMVSKLLRKCGSGKKIDRLEIIGHGNATGQYVGADWLDSGSLSTHRGELGRLAPFFSPSAVVTLGGCSVGRASSLLIELSGLWPGVTVRAMTANQRPLLPGEEGGVRECVRRRCSSSGEGFWDWVDH